MRAKSPVEISISAQPTQLLKGALAIVENNLDFLNSRAQRTVLKFKQGDNRPLIVADHPKDLYDGSISLAEGCAMSVVSSAVAQMHAGHAIVMLLHKCQAVLIGRSEVASVQ